MKIRFLLSVTALIVLIQLASGQQNSLQVRIKNHPFNTFAVGYVRGDKFTLCDSVLTSNVMVSGVAVKIGNWSFPSDAQPGIYRIIFGQTTYARVMDEPPQQLDILFNGEDIRLETDFKAPFDSLKIFSSEENRVWFSFLKKEMEFRQKLKEFELEVNYYQDKLAGQSAGIADGDWSDLEAKAANVANKFNLLQMERETFITTTAAENAHLFVARIMKLHREPFRDGYLSVSERNASCQRNYFRFIDFSDETLINTPVLTDKIFNYLVTYNRQDFNKNQREDAYISAVDAVMKVVEETAGQGGVIHEFVLDYLVNGFERLNMNKVLRWIADNYAGSLCKTDEKTTLLRKLEAQKMITGTVVPDFTLNDLNGQQVTFSQLSKDRNLIVFWASWCPHCSSLFPGIKSLCSGKSDLEVFAISLDKSESDWHKAVADVGIERFRNLSDLKEWDGKVAEDYNIYATPTLFLVDGNRKVIARPANIEELAILLSE